jgi:hypothetical protein
VQRVELTIGIGNLDVPVGEAQALWREALATAHAAGSRQQT